jgi:diaminohydroxyphosphoribosylaminopyrimidine deaminase / 5-amino-6-(5-phosphoribosylamino)uracil reductase
LLNTAEEHASERHATGDGAWDIVVAAAREAEPAAIAAVFATYALATDSTLQSVPADHADALVAWRPGTGWEPALSTRDPRYPLIDLYLPICSATATRPITVGHLGQSLDGFIATHAGDSQFVTGEENILHLHRMRALCDAIIVGAGTVAADDPQLTTRRVKGPSPLRVIFDPTRGLGENYRVFRDASAETLYVCARSLTRPGESHFGRASLVAIDDDEDQGAGVDVADLLRLLRQRGCARIFVEGGGVTVSTFLEASLLDRLQIAIAPLIIGDGRPAIRLEPRAALRDCQRPSYRVFRMGGDVLFDCDLRAPDDSPPDGLPRVARVI